MTDTKKSDGGRQLSLVLPGSPPLYTRAGFVRSEANDAAWRAGQAWIVSDDPALIICGPSGAGKTHLAHVLAEGQECSFLDAERFADSPPVNGLIIVDNLPSPDPRAFLTRLETAIAGGARCILAGGGHPADWAMGLKDLRTRLEAMPRAVMNEPDETLIRAVIAKGFRDRQVEVNPVVIDFAAPRLPRTFAAAHAFVALADRAGLDEKRKISVGLVQKLVDNLSEGDLTA